MTNTDELNLNRVLAHSRVFKAGNTPDLLAEHGVMEAFQRLLDHSGAVKSVQAQLNAAATGYCSAPPARPDSPVRLNLENEKVAYHRWQDHR